MSWSWLRVLAVIAVVALGLGGLVGARSTAADAATAGVPARVSDTIVRAADGVVADSASSEVSSVLPIRDSGWELARGINASASSAATCRCEAHMQCAPESGGPGDAAMLVEDDGNDGDEYALPGSLTGIGSHRGAARDVAAWADQLPESPAPSLPDDPPAT